MAESMTALRTCRHCQQPKVATKAGLNVCPDCRARTCVRCRRRNVKTQHGLAVCVECRRVRRGQPIACRTCQEVIATDDRTRKVCDPCKVRTQERCNEAWKARRKVDCSSCGRICWSEKTGLCATCARRARKTTGHSYINGSGYVMVRIGPKHYIREHVIVMERTLGRPLLPGENVHHLNGVRTDNRPENLELWVTMQPAGQRAADLLAWARETIERYEPVEDRLAV